jgi:hypothetical protein
LQQVVRFLVYTGRAANVAATAESDPEQTLVIALSLNAVRHFAGRRTAWATDRRTAELFDPKRNPNSGPDGLPSP